MLSLFLLFYAGIILQAAFLLVDDFKLDDIKVLALCIGLSIVVGLIPGKNEHNYNLYLHLFIIAVVFACAYGAIFKKRLLQKINKEIF